VADCTCTNFPSRLGFITFGNGVVVDNDNDSNGVPDIRFGGTVSGEGVGSTRASGGANQYGVDLYTDYTQRLSITNGGLVGIGTTSPTQLLHLQGGSLYINGGSILVSGDVTTGRGRLLRRQHQSRRLRRLLLRLTPERQKGQAACLPGRIILRPRAPMCARSTSMKCAGPSIPAALPLASPPSPGPTILQS